jgi:hypothetical protein
VLLVNGNSGNVNGRPQYGGGYYQSRSSGPRPDSVAEDYDGRDTRNSYPPRPMRYGSTPMFSNSNAERIYPSHGHQPSYDTITTVGGSYGTDPRGDSTDPSSQNSSVDRFPLKPEDHSGDSNGIGYSNGPYSPVSPNYNNEQTYWKGSNGRPQAPYGYSNGNASNHQIQQSSHGYSNGNPSNSKLQKTPIVPQKDDRPTAPIKLDTGFDAGTPPTPPKKQSWLKRRFSRNK